MEFGAITLTGMDEQCGYWSSGLFLLTERKEDVIFQVVTNYAFYEMERGNHAFPDYMDF